MCWGQAIMKPYLSIILDYAPAMAGAVAGGVMMVCGVGRELSDFLGIDGDILRMGIDTLVGVVPMFAAGGIVEGAKALCTYKVEAKLPGDYQQ
jgi:hypothetical protein